MYQNCPEPQQSPKDCKAPNTLKHTDHHINLMRQVFSQENFDSQAESLLGVPPPVDGEISFTSLNSSLSMPDFEAQDQLSLIKNKNKELQRTATLTIQDFKNTSRSLLSRSQIRSDKDSMILAGSEALKKDLELTNEEGKNQNSLNRSLNMASMEADDNMGLVYLKIQDIQKEINEAAQRLLESEKMIMSTEEKNQVLENRIKELEKSLSCLDVTEGPDKSRSENCKCILS